MDKPKLVYTHYIKATPENTWAAITNPEFTRQYWGGMTNVSEWKTGSKWEHRAPNNEVWIAGEVVECTPPKRLVLTWFDPDNTADVSRVTMEIEPAKDTVCLTVIHDGFKAYSTMAGKVSGGWPRVLSSLKSYLETGKGLLVADCSA